MLRNTLRLKLLIGLPGGLDQQFGTQREMVQMGFHFQALQFEHGKNRHQRHQPVGFHCGNKVLFVVALESGEL